MLPYAIEKLRLFMLKFERKRKKMKTKWDSDGE